ncbi:UDP-N-acetylglucosamine 2-epimerase (non-hydrolyzing) [Candidatus Gracilibacteria bacterium]|nr:UDP-N-acetylglucosamine 2-epimerase (non-hydrolyzing) [Candidatus Gracilibacteria bacterium]
MINIFIIAGARPNFMKIAPIIREFQKHSDKISFKLIHTGQHFDTNMSGSFFDELGIPTPDINLEIHGGSVSEQIGKVMIALDPLFREEKPDYILVVGDVNATIAGALAAQHNQIRVIHVEAGLRSFDMSMPEEINRIVTDRLSYKLFVTEQAGVDNLNKDGIVDGVHHVGNVMIDTLVYQLPIIKKKTTAKDMGLLGRDYALLTIHRPVNVDTEENLRNLMMHLRKLSEKILLVFPLHPRTRANIEKYQLGHLFETPNIITTEPLGYLDFMSVLTHAKCILTDSGGIQEESTYLQIPCLTMRENTERPITCEIGSNTMVGTDFGKIEKYLDDIIAGKYKKGEIPQLWDGKTAERIIKLILTNNIS